MGHDTASGEWHHFRHPEGLFSIEYSPRWRQRPDPQSTAALQCVSATGDEIFDVLALSANSERPTDIADIVADGIEKQIRSYAGARVIERAVIQRGSNGRCLRVRGEYLEAGYKMAVEYYIAAAGREALYVALKCTADRYAAARGDLIKAWGSLSTTWLRQTGHSRKVAVASAQRETREEPRSSRLWLRIVLAIVVAGAAAYAWTTFQPPTQ